mmetsp:Transcript_14686/g.35470  ORF Transcript_14686/g.35470 Transcript_14686/m.35470 type:complete len:211 (-) Transcript_14686:198-830(-)
MCVQHFLRFRLPRHLHDFSPRQQLIVPLKIRQLPRHPLVVSSPESYVFLPRPRYLGSLSIPLGCELQSLHLLVVRNRQQKSAVTQLRRAHRVVHDCGDGIWGRCSRRVRLRIPARWIIRGLEVELDVGDGGDPELVLRVLDVSHHRLEEFFVPQVHLFVLVVEHRHGVLVHVKIVVDDGEYSLANTRTELRAFEGLSQGRLYVFADRLGD